MTTHKYHSLLKQKAHQQKSIYCCSMLLIHFDYSRPYQILCT